MSNVRDITGKAAPKFREIAEIMSQPSMKAKLSSFIDEAVMSKGKIQFEQEHIKAIREQAKEELGLKPQIFNSYVQVVFNNDYIQRKDKLEELVDMIDAIMLEQGILPNDE